MDLIVVGALVGVAAFLSCYVGLGLLKLGSLSRNLGGKWTWEYALDADGTPWLSLKLWTCPDDAHTMQMMSAATWFRAYAPEGLAVIKMDETVGPLRRSCFLVMLANDSPVLAARRHGLHRDRRLARVPFQTQVRETGTDDMGSVVIPAQDANPNLVGHVVMGSARAVPGDWETHPGKS